MGYSEKCRAYKVIENGRDAITYARSIIFNEAPLVQKLNQSRQQSNPNQTAQHLEDSESFDIVPVTPELYSETKWPEHAILQEKKATPVIIKKSAAKSRTPAPANQRAISFSETITPAAPPKQDQRLRGKHSRLRRELSLAISTSVDKCSVVHQEDIHTWTCLNLN